MNRRCDDEEAAAHRNLNSKHLSIMIKKTFIAYVDVLLFLRHEDQAHAPGETSSNNRDLPAKTAA
jgi:hypothetical protein